MSIAMRSFGLMAMFQNWQSHPFLQLQIVFVDNNPTPKPGLFGLKHSNRDFTQRDAWGKNCFNSSFPASLCSYLHSQGLENIYIKLNSNLEVEHSSLSTDVFYGIEPNSDDLFYAFETQFTPYQQFLIGTLPGVDLVTQSKATRSCLQAIEIKLTALPDNTTCDLAEDYYGCEIVVRPDTIVYLACSIADTFRSSLSTIHSLIGEKFSGISDWTEPNAVIPYVPDMVSVIDSIALLMLEEQTPFLMQPIWKTEGKSPKLAENCLDVFVWSNLAFTRLFIDLAKRMSEKYLNCHAERKEVKRSISVDRCNPRSFVALCSTQDDSFAF